jgi:transcriptional regulator with XRE-family HTH domain
MNTLDSVDNLALNTPRGAAELKSTHAFQTNLASILKARGLNQNRLAGKLGVVRSTITNYIKGDRRIDLDVLDSIAEALGVPPCELIADLMGHSDTRTTLEFYAHSSTPIKRLAVGKLALGEVTDRSQIFDGDFEEK